MGRCALEAKYYFTRPRLRETWTRPRRHLTSPAADSGVTFLLAQPTAEDRRGRTNTSAETFGAALLGRRSAKSSRPMVMEGRQPTSAPESKTRPAAGSVLSLEGESSYGVRSMSSWVPTQRRVALLPAMDIVSL